MRGTESNLGQLGSHVEKIEFEQSFAGLVGCGCLGRVGKAFLGKGGRHRAGSEE